MRRRLAFEYESSMITFRLLAVTIDHHVDGVAGFNGNGSVGLPDLLDGDHPFELVSEIDNDFLRRDLYDVALQQLPFSGRSKMAIVFNEMFEVFVNREIDIDIPLVRAAGHHQAPVSNH